MDAKTGKKLGYGELAADAAKLPVPKTADLTLKDPKDFRYIGKGKTQLVDGFDITTGRAIYAQDVRGARHGLRRGGALSSSTAGRSRHSSPGRCRCRRVPGVVKVIEIKQTPVPSAFQPLAGVAVIANTTWAAIQGRKALKIVWNDGQRNVFVEYPHHRNSRRRVEPGKEIRVHGDVDKAMSTAAKTLKADYYVPC